MLLVIGFCVLATAGHGLGVLFVFSPVHAVETVPLRNASWG